MYTDKKFYKLDMKVKNYFAYRNNNNKSKSKKLKQNRIKLSKAGNSKQSQPACVILILLNSVQYREAHSSVLIMNPSENQTVYFL